MFDTNFKRGVLAVAGSILVDISVGEINLLGFLYPYFVAYFRIYDKSITIEDMRLIPICWLLAQIYSCPLGVYVYSKIGFRYTYLLFITTFCLIQWVSSYITNFKLFAIIYGFSGGTSQGALLILPIYCCWRYFAAKHKAKVSGMVLSAYALSPLFTSFLALYAINPDNLRQTDIADNGKKYFPEEVAHRVPDFLRLFGIVCAVVGYTGTFMMLEPLTFEDEIMESNAFEMAILDSGAEGGKSPASPQEMRESIVVKRKEQLSEQIQNISPVSLTEAKNLFKVDEFKYIYLIMVLGFMFPHMMNFSFKSIGLDYLQDDNYVTVVGSIGAVVNALSRLFVGMAYQSYGYLRIGLAILTIEVIIALLYVPLAGNKLTYFINTVLFEITYGGQLGMYPLLSDMMFKKKGAICYAYLYSSFTISLIVVLNLYSYLKQWISLYAPFFVVAIISMAALPWILKIGRMEDGARSIIGHDPLSGIVNKH